MRNVKLAREKLETRFKKTGKYSLIIYMMWLSGAWATAGGSVQSKGDAVGTASTHTRCATGGDERMYFIGYRKTVVNAAHCTPTPS